MAEEQEQDQYPRDRQSNGREFGYNCLRGMGFLNCLRSMGVHDGYIGYWALDFWTRSSGELCLLSYGYFRSLLHISQVYADSPLNAADRLIREAYSRNTKQETQYE